MWKPGTTLDWRNVIGLIFLPEGACVKLTESYHRDLLKRLRDNPKFALAYLNECLQDPDEGSFLLALRDVAEAHGFKNLAEKSRITREHLFRMLSRNGNPRLTSLRQLTKALGWTLALVEEEKPKMRKAA